MMRLARPRFTPLTGLLGLVITLAVLAWVQWGSIIRPEPRDPRDPAAAGRAEAPPPLWGGLDPETHFDSADLRLDRGRLRYGVGRERFPALIDPDFAPPAAFEAWLDGGDRGDPAAAARGPATRHDGQRVLVVEGRNELRVYPLRVLQTHEVVNDVVDGAPLLVAYCPLADLAAVYERTIGEHTLTFGVSGYTYQDPAIGDGREAFVLWDRDTESLWWPLAESAVSGPLVDVPLRTLDAARWRVTTWGAVRGSTTPLAVLAPRQQPGPIPSWPRLSPAHVARLRAAALSGNGGRPAGPPPAPPD